MPVIWRDPESGLFAVSKPAGTVVFQWDFQFGGYPRVWEILRRNELGNHAHRIDEWTSGVLMCGQSRSDVGYLRRIWADKSKLRKYYLAVIENVLWERIEIEYPIGGALACTEFVVLSRDDSCKFALVRCELVRFGRTHQIRKHAKILGSPLVGDWRFKGFGARGKDRESEQDVRLEARRDPHYGRLNQFLHAWKVELELPSGARDTVLAPVPEDFHSFSFDWGFLDEERSEHRVEGEVYDIPPLSQMPDYEPFDPKLGWKGWTP